MSRRRRQKGLLDVIFEDIDSGDMFLQPDVIEGLRSAGLIGAALARNKNPYLAAAGMLAPAVANMLAGSLEREANKRCRRRGGRRARRRRNNQRR